MHHETTANSRRFQSTDLMTLALLMVLALFGFKVAVACAGEREQASTIQHRVVMHLNSGEEKVQRGVLNNIKHLYKELGSERLQVELVVHGAGLTLFTKKDTRLGEELRHIKEAYGVQFTACSNTMKAMKLTREDLIDYVDRTVPAMVRLMELQEQGWAYIKP